MLERQLVSFYTIGKSGDEKERYNGLKKVIVRATELIGIITLIEAFPHLA